MVQRAALLALILAAGFSAMRFVSKAAEPGKSAAATPAGDSAKNSANKPAAPGAVEELSPVERVLSQPATLKFTKTPLKDVAAKLAERFKINVLLDRKTLDECNISEQTPISFELKDVSLGHALHWMLRPLDLDFCTLADGNVLLITTSEKAKTTAIVHVYDVRELVGHDEIDAEGKRSPAYDSLIDLITSCVVPQTWDTAGGAGSIAPGFGTLTVSQTEGVHEEIAELLAALQRVRRSPGATDPVTVESPAVAQAAAATRAKLARLQDVHLPETTLTELRDRLTAQGIPTLLDLKALAEANIPTDTKLSACDFKNIDISWALQSLLSERDLTCCVDAGVLVVTTYEQEKLTTGIIVYPASDLTDSPLPSLTRVEQDDVSDFDTIIEAITSTVAPSSWDSAGGIGAMAVLPSAKVLVCSQTFETREEIARLLAMLRAQVRGGKAAGEKPPQADNSPVVRVYTLFSPADGGKELAAADARAERYVSVVRDLIEPKSWTDGSGYIAAVPGRIVVRQTPGVQKRVRKLLEDLGAIPGANAKKLVGNRVPVVGLLGRPISR